MKNSDSTVCTCFSLLNKMIEKIKMRTRKVNIFQIYIISALVITVTFNPACKKKNPGEKEPNNVFFNANSLEVDSTVEGFLNTDNDNDFYIADIKSPVILDIELTAVKGVNHAFKIWREKEGQQILIKYIDDSRKSSPERMCGLLADMGVYYISVLHGDRDPKKANAEDAYRLTVTSSVWESEEIEPNDDRESATPVEIGKEVSGYFSPSFNKLNRRTSGRFREEDWYCFNIEEDTEEPVLIDLELSGVPDVNSSIVLYSPDDEVLASSDLRGAGEGESIRDIGLTKAGKYFIIVCSAFESNCMTPYTLAVKSRIHDFSSEIEPNNNFKKANKIAGDVVKGRMFPAGDTDFYLYNNESGTENKSLLYKIEASSESGLDLSINIYNYNQKKIFEIDNFRGGEKEIINLALPDKYYLEIKSAKNELSETPYILSVKPLPYTDGYEMEPNDSRERATLVTGGRIIGFINMKKDIDYYYLNYNNRVKKSFILHGIKDSQLKISITDPLGFIIKTETVTGDESKSITEIVDMKGYIVIEAEKENFEEPYMMEIGD